MHGRLNGKNTCLFQLFIRLFCSVIENSTRILSFCVEVVFRKINRNNCIVVIGVYEPRKFFGTLPEYQPPGLAL